MPLRKVQLVNGEFYHIIQRGIEEREIFSDEEDHLRFVNSLLVFNDKNPTPWQSRMFWHQRDPAVLSLGYQPKIPLVELHIFALMKNHFHLLVRQLTENGVAEFMQKIGGYVWYFNKKYERIGPLFQGRYKIKRIETEPQLKNNFVYIATNPVGIIEPEWKDWKVNAPQKAIQFLEQEYRWSGYRDYLGGQNFPSVTTRSFFLKLFGGERGIKKEIDSWILFKAPIQYDGDDGAKFFE